MPTRDRRAGPNGARRPQRREEKIRRAATLAAMQYRLRWPERRLRATESNLGQPDGLDDRTTGTAEQFEQALFPERGTPPGWGPPNDEE